MLYKYFNKTDDMPAISMLFNLEVHLMANEKAMTLAS